MRSTLLTVLLAASVILPAAALAQTPAAAPPRTFTHADTLRGANGPGRAWWDATFYDLHVRVNPADSSITGHNAITYRVLQPATEMQIDLQVPLEVDSIVQQSARLQYRRDGNAFFVTVPAAAKAGDRATITVWYHGNWRRAPGDTATRRRNPGPFHWAVDSAGAPWIATSNEGPGASTWWPLKDLPADEPDSQRIAITVPDPMINVSNGRLRSTTKNADGTTTFEWFVSNPINTYDVAINASPAYVPVRDDVHGREGKADARVLAAETTMRRRRRADAPGEADAQLPRALVRPVSLVHRRLQADRDALPRHGAPERHRLWQPLPARLPRPRSLRHRPGPELGLHHRARERPRMVGQQHQRARTTPTCGSTRASALRRGALHSSAQGKGAGEKYLVGIAPRDPERHADHRHLRRQHTPRSQDRYPKGANMLHDDARRGRTTTRSGAAPCAACSRRSGHQTVTAKQIARLHEPVHRASISRRSSMQYQDTTKIPALEYRFDGKQLSCRWTNVVPGFAMPVEVGVAAEGYQRIRPTEEWQTVASSSRRAPSFGSTRCST